MKWTMKLIFMSQRFSKGLDLNIKKLKDLGINVPFSYVVLWYYLYIDESCREVSSCFKIV